MLFFTPRATIEEAKELIMKFRLREEIATDLGQQIFLKPEEIDRLKKADKIVGGAVHPDTGLIIPFYQRFSGFVVFNTPIMLITLFAKTQTPLFGFVMQWVNQTYNACMNYGNRNASSPLSNQDLAKGYVGAVLVSGGIAYGSRIAFAKQLAQIKGPKAIFATAIVTYFAAAFAGASNLLMMRQKEIVEGVKI